MNHNLQQNPASDSSANTAVLSKPSSSSQEVLAKLNAARQRGEAMLESNVIAYSQKLIIVQQLNKIETAISMVGCLREVSRPERWKLQQCRDGDRGSLAQCQLP